MHSRTTNKQTTSDTNEFSSGFGHRRCSGFTLIELLVVIAIIAFMIGPLLPGLHRKRMADASDAAETNLRNIADAAIAYHGQRRELPATLKDLAAFCAANPSLCKVDPNLLASGRDANSYYVQVSGARIWKVIVDPQLPGLSGLRTWGVELSDSPDRPFIIGFISNPTPGALKAESEMIARVRGAGAKTIAEVLSLDLSALTQIRAFARSPATRTDVLSIIDANNDGNVSLQEAAYDWPGEFAQVFDGTNPAIERPVLEFLNVVRREMNLVDLSPEERSGVFLTVGFFETLDGGQTFTQSGLCEITQSYVTEKRVADWLCAKLAAADDAEKRGDFRAKARALEQYTEELRSETNKTVTYKNAITLNLIAQTLSTN